MKYNLKKPCSNCPFRTDKPEQEGWLGYERAEEIVDGLTRQQGTFTCHKTSGKINEEHCAGALIMLEKMEKPNQMMRISERIGMYDRTKLYMGSPVFDDAEDFIDSHAE